MRCAPGRSSPACATTAAACCSSRDRPVFVRVCSRLSAITFFSQTANEVLSTPWDLRGARYTIGTAHGAEHESRPRPRHRSRRRRWLVRPGGPWQVHRARRRSRRAHRRCPDCGRRQCLSRRLAGNALAQGGGREARPRPAHDRQEARRYRQLRVRDRARWRRVVRGRTPMAPRRLLRRHENGEGVP